MENEPQEKPKRTISARVDADLADWIEQVAKTEDRSLSYVVNRMLIEARARKDRKK